MIVGPDRLAEAVEVLRRGGLVAFPTETVYGLGADASNPRAVERIFEAKGRPADHPLIVHIPASASLDRWAIDIPYAARRLVAACWPGALTVVLRKSPQVSIEVTGGLDTVGLRVPQQPLALSLLGAFGGGIAAPSANRFGRVSPTRAEHVAAELGDRVDLIIDGGPCRIGLESTIIDLTREPPEVLRPGGVDVETLEAVLETPVSHTASGEARAPGMLATHYAPRARVEIVQVADVARRVRERMEQKLRVGVLAPEPMDELPAGVVQLGPAGNAAAYARVLYARLREADARDLDVVVCIPPPPGGIGAAVRDRLQRAAMAR